jgi:hypothetical protein
MAVTSRPANALAYFSLAGFVVREYITRWLCVNKFLAFAPWLAAYPFSPIAKSVLTAMVPAGLAGFIAVIGVRPVTAEGAGVFHLLHP